MKCAEKDGKVYSLNNRMLHVTRVPVSFTMFVDANVDVLPFQHIRVHRLRQSTDRLLMLVAPNYWIATSGLDATRHLIAARHPSYSLLHFSLDVCWTN